ncbi:hypothetical protein BS78_K014400 [Paspalum vaginatum]|uniref:Uncharacterized protein n=1 Tax=Paspalum vaginatum TaxID=158149 RepID=A0A9W8CF35_9POAL|nr:hypothetical protein BS78_K014400 [Paspalum vaginatum]
MGSLLARFLAEHSSPQRRRLPLSADEILTHPPPPPTLPLSAFSLLLSAAWILGDLGSTPFVSIPVRYDTHTCVLVQILCDSS